MIAQSITEIPKGYKKTEVGIIPEDWEAEPIGSFLEFKNGLNKAKEFFGKGTPIVNYMDVFSNAGLLCSDIEGKVTLTSDEIRNYQVKKGDVFFTRTSETVDEIGMSSVMLEDIKDAVFSGFVLRGRPKNDNLHPLYKKYCFRFEKVRKQIRSTSSYTTRALTNGRLLSKVFIPVPPQQEEQESIARVLSDIDTLIIKLEELIEKKRNVKQGTMQELLTGKKRLPGFSGKWEVKKLGDVVVIKKGQLITEDSRIKGPIPVIAGGKTPAYYHNKANRCGRTITVSGSGANAGYVAFHSYPIFASDCSTIEESKDYVIEFVFYLLQLNQEKIYNSQTGGAQPHIHPSDLKPLFVLFPKQVEQQAIAQVLSDMDSEIEELEQKLNKYKMIKQGMMQELLTGKTRLI